MAEGFVKTSVKGTSIISTGNKELDKARLEAFELNEKLKIRNHVEKNQGLADLLAGGGSADQGRPGFNVSAGKSVQIGGSVALDKLYGKSEPGGIHQILGTSNPTGGVDTNLFTVLGKHTARVSVLWVANRRLVKAKIKVGFDVAGGNTNIVPDDAWLYYNVEVPGESTLVLDAATGLWLGARDDVVIRTDISGVSFGASGVEYATV